jgi:predicted nucleotidyltransferase
VWHKDEEKNPDDTLQIIAELRDELYERFTVKRIGIFGSYARGDEDPESDVDLIEELIKPTLDHYMDLKFMLEDILRRPIDLVLADTVKPRIKPIMAHTVYAYFLR